MTLKFADVKEALRDGLSSPCKISRSCCCRREACVTCRSAELDAFGIPREKAGQERRRCPSTAGQALASESDPDKRRVAKDQTSSHTERNVGVLPFFPYRQTG